MHLNVLLRPLKNLINAWRNLRLFKLLFDRPVKLFYNPFILIIDFFNIDPSFAIDLINTYRTSQLIDLNIGTQTFTHNLGRVYPEPVDQDIWNYMFEKIVGSYCEVVTECISPSYIVKVIHSLCLFNRLQDTTHHPCWISANVNNPLNLLTCYTLIDPDVSEIIFKFKNFKAVKVKRGETIIFPSHFEYGYNLITDKQDTTLIFSQVFDDRTLAS